MSLKLLALGDIHQNAAAEDFSAGGIALHEGSVEHSTRAAVSPADLQLQIAHETVALHALHFPGAQLGINEIGDFVAPQLIQVGHSQRLQQRWIGVQKISCRIGDVDALLQPCHQLAQIAGILQAAQRWRR